MIWLLFGALALIILALPVIEALAHHDPRTLYEMIADWDTHTESYSWIKEEDK